MSVRVVIGTIPGRRRRSPGEALVDLRRRLSLLRARDPGRTEVIRRVAEAYGVSVWTIYRALRELTRPKSVRRYRLVDTERSPRKAVVRMSGFPRVSPKPA